MRKFYFLLVFFLFVSAGFINAQTFEVLQKDTDAAVPDTVIFMTDTSKSTIRDFYFRFKNNMPRETEIGVARRLVSGPITFTNACFGGTCYSFSSSNTVDTLSATFTVDANATYDEFHASISWQDDTVAVCRMDYIFFTSTDSVVVPVKIVISAQPSQVITLSNKKKEIERPYPVPADKVINFDYHIAKDGELVFYNILGSEQKRVLLDKTLSHVTIPVSSLKSGVYFYSLYVDGVKKTTSRMMIKH